ncbi:MAG: hypothetical protein WC494_01970 [Candidatus Pacearchaeota archaeon]
MKKEIIFLAFIVSLSLVASMDEPITVKTNPGDHVKLYAWKSEGGPLLVMKEGIAEGGTFKATFFSLNEEKVKYQVIILRGGEKVRDEDFENQTISEPLLIDCLPATCTISIYGESESLDENFETIEVNSSSLLSEENVNLNESNDSMVSQIFPFREYLLSNIWIIGVFFLGIILFVIILFLVLLFRKREKFYNKEEKELEELQRKIKEKSEEIKRIKEERLRKQKINEAKKKLAEKETELKRLKGYEAKITFEKNNKKEMSNKPVIIKEEGKKSTDLRGENEKKSMEETGSSEKKTNLYDNSLGNKVSSETK